MNDKKIEIMKAAFPLFTNRGYHATSIQDILHKTGISKGTFYKYFQSKDELFQSTLLFTEAENKKERNRVLFGKDETSKKIFIEQMTIVLSHRMENNFIPLMEEALSSSSGDLISCVNQLRLEYFHWLHYRFIQIFPQKYKGYLLDTVIIFAGMLQNILKLNVASREPLSTKKIVIYSMNQIEVLLEELSQKGERLFESNDFQELFAGKGKESFVYKDLALANANMIKFIDKIFIKGSKKYELAYELLMFIQEEIVTDNSKTFLVRGSLTSLMNIKEIKGSRELKTLIKTLEQHDIKPII